jgi:protein SCO1/2
VTVDPERDTPEVARAYVGGFFAANAHALRDEDPDALRSTAEAFGVQYEVVKADDGTVEVGHSALLSLVDERGDVVVQWPFGVTADDLANDLRKILDEGA